MRHTLLHALVLGLLVLAGCSSRSDDLAAITAQKTLRIGVKADAPPFGSRAGAMRAGAMRVGFDIDIATAIAQRLGAEPVFVDVTSANRIDLLTNGEVDLLVASMTITRSREQLVDFSIPYFQDGQALLVKKTSTITGYQGLAGRAVGAVTGSTSATNLHQVAPDAQVQEFPDFAALLAALASGQVEAITSDRFILMGLARQAKPAGTYRFAGPLFSTEPYGIAMRQNQSALRTAVNHALLELWEDGTWRQIRETWFGPGTPFASDIRFVITPYPK